MKSKKLKLSSAIAVLLTAAFLIVSCKKQQEEAFVTFYGGTVTIQSFEHEARPAQVGDEIKDGDLIETGEKSFLVIQAGDGIIFRIESESTLEITSLADLENKEISLDRGKVISKLQRGRNYSVRTPTAVAAVRGTEFLTEYVQGRTIVAVGSGRVDVVRDTTGEEIVVETGKTAVVSEKEDEAVELRDINRVEELEVEKIQVTPVIDDTEKTDSALYEEKQTEMEMQIEKIMEEMDRQSWTLDRIREEYGRIDVVTLYSGRVIRGAILSRGNVVRILTPSGIVPVEAREIRTTGMM